MTDKAKLLLVCRRWVRSQLALGAGTGSGIIEQSVCKLARKLRAKCSELEATSFMGGKIPTWARDLLERENVFRLPLVPAEPAAPVPSIGSSSDPPAQVAAPASTPPTDGDSSAKSRGRLRDRAIDLYCRMHRAELKEKVPACHRYSSVTIERSIKRLGRQRFNRMTPSEQVSLAAGASASSGRVSEAREVDGTFASAPPVDLDKVPLVHVGVA